MFHFLRAAAASDFWWARAAAVCWASTLTSSWASVRRAAGASCSKFHFLRAAAATDSSFLATPSSFTSRATTAASALASSLSPCFSSLRALARLEIIACWSSYAFLATAASSASAAAALALAAALAGCFLSSALASASSFRRASWATLSWAILALHPVFLTRQASRLVQSEYAILGGARRRRLRMPHFCSANNSSSSASKRRRPVRYLVSQPPQFSILQLTSASETSFLNTWFHAFLMIPNSWVCSTETSSDSSSWMGMATAAATQRATMIIFIMMVIGPELLLSTPHKVALG